MCLVISGLTMRLLVSGTIITASSLLASCTSATKPELLTAGMEATSVPAPRPRTCVKYREVGLASWYGRELHGRKTASGETFDMNAVSAAHRTLPLGTMIKVVNLDNYRSLETKINDRGPLTRNRILELSYRAAKELGFVETGTGLVKIETVEPIEETETPFTVHVGAFLEKESALSLKERLGKRFESVFVNTVETNTGTFYRVLVGAYPSEEKAERIAAKLTLEGVEPVILRKDY